MESIYIVDEPTGEVVYDSEWPVIEISFAEMCMVGNDLAAFDDGDITADEFTEFWGMHPNANFSFALKPADG